jgi:hypothetical protein
MESGEEFPPERIFTMIATNETQANETPQANLEGDRATPAKKPISEAKLLANRRNGALSHGPVTDAGRRRSSLNGYRNGLNGQIVCSTPEELAAFKSFCSEIQSELAPVGAIERFYAKSVAENMYRLEKARSLDMGMFANGHRDHVDEMQSGHPEADTALAASRTFLEQADAFKLLSGYESKILRALENHQAQLKTLQTERKAAYEKAVEQATQFIELAEAMEETYEPGEDFTPASAHGGFAFSADEIDRRRVRAAHLRAAWVYRSEGKLPNRAPKPEAKTPLRAA